MGLETGNFINDLVVTNPVGASDPKSQGDDHLRLIKTALKTSLSGFPGAVIITGTDTGAANAYVLTPTPVLPSYQSGMLALLKPANASTGVSTINISSLGAKTIKTLEGASIDANDLLAGTYYWLVYDGTDFRIVGAPTKRYVDALAFSTVLPDQAGNAGKYLNTNGTTASWTDPFASPALTGTPTAPTAAPGTSTTQIANTEFATTAVAGHFKIAGAATPQQAAFGTASGANTGYLTSTTNTTKGKWFLNSAGTITVDEANLRFGIDNASPGSTLHVGSGTNAFRVNATGNMAVGTATPSSNFTVYSAVNSSNTLPSVKFENTGTGDASAFFVAGGQIWSHGIDQSDSQKFKISHDNSGADVGVGTKFCIDLNGNIGINGQVTFGTSAVGVFAQANGTAPTSSPADSYQIYSADQAAGNACLHVKTENGDVIKIFRGNAITTPSGGATIDSEARTAITAILARLRVNGGNGLGVIAD